MSSNDKNFTRFCCELIQESVILLRLPQIVACTGQCIFHNFVSKRTNESTTTMENALSISMACGFLASKVEERMRIHLMRDFMKVFNYIYFKRVGEAKIPDLELGGFVFFYNNPLSVTRKQTHSQQVQVLQMENSTATYGT